MVPDKQVLLNVPFQTTKFGKKELCVDIIKTIGDVYCPTCRNEKCVYLSTNKTTSFYGCIKCKACCHVLNIHFKDQKPTIMLFGSDGTHWWSTTKFMFAWSRDWTTLLPLRKTISALHFQLCRFLKHYVLHCTRCTAN